LRPSAAELAADAAATRALLDSTLHVVRQIAPTFRARLEDAQQALQAMQLAMAEAGALERNITGGAAAQFMRNPAFITSLQRSREHAAALSLLLRERTRDDALQSDVTAGLRRLQSRADSLTALLDSAAQSLSGGLLVRAQRDSALVHAVFRARAQLDSLIAETKRNPLRFFFCRLSCWCDALRRAPTRWWLPIDREDQAVFCGRRAGWRRLHDDPTHNAMRIIQLDLELDPLLARLHARPDLLTRRLRSLRCVLEQRLRRLPATLERTRHLHQLEPVRLVSYLVRLSSLVHTTRDAVVTRHPASTVGLFERARNFPRRPGPCQARNCRFPPACRRCRINATARLATARRSLEKTLDHRTTP
jgi:hypothetical protein